MAMDNINWIPASNPPSDASRVIAKNQNEDISEAFYFKPKEWIKSVKKPAGFYVPHGGDTKLWLHVTHYIYWPSN